MESPKDNERRTLPTPPEILALRRGWYALIGGEKGCPRKRFFISMTIAGALLAAISHLYFPCVSIALIDSMDNEGVFLPLLNMVLCILSAIAVALGGIASRLFTSLFEELRIFPMTPIPAFENGRFTEDVSVQIWAFYLSSPLVVLVGVAAFCLAWRRLRDAGRSPLNLIAGLFTLLLWLLDLLLWLLEDASLVPLKDGVWGNIMSFILYNLGAFWLLRLYCQPTKTPVSAEESNAGTNAA